MAASNIPRRGKKVKRPVRKRLGRDDQYDRHFARKQDNEQVEYRPTSEKTLSTFLQQNLFVLLSYHDKPAHIIMKKIDVGLFEGYYKKIASNIYSYIKKYNEVPKAHLADLFEAELEPKKDDRQTKQKASHLADLIQEVHDARHDINVDYTMDMLDKLLDYQSIKRGTLSIAEMFKDDTVNEETISKAQRIFEETQERLKRRSDVLSTATLDLTNLANREVPDREWCWQPWLPARIPTFLHGLGGVGKSLLVQQIATAVALGKDLFGNATEQQRVMLLSGEDDAEELWRRQVAICERMGVELEDLAGKLDLVAVPDQDITLARIDDNGVVTVTPWMHELRETIEQGGHGLLLLDNAAKLFAVKEGNRIGITRAVGLLFGFCHDFGTTVVLVGHDNKEGDYSGSTAWENACRSRLHMKKNDNAGVTLSMAKANYAGPDNTVDLRWERWSFVSESTRHMGYKDRKVAMKAQKEGQKIFLRALDKLTRQQISVSEKSRAANYAPKVMIKHKLNRGLSAHQLQDAMIVLLNKEQIRANAVIEKSSHRNALKGIARVDADDGEDGQEE